MPEKCRHPEFGVFCRAKDLSVLRAAPPRRNKRAFSTLPNCFLSVVKLPRGRPATTHYFYDSQLQRVNTPTLQKYIRFMHSNLRGIGLPKGLDKISAKTRFCTNLGANRSKTPRGTKSDIPSEVEGRCVHLEAGAPPFFLRSLRAGGHDFNRNLPRQKCGVPHPSAHFALGWEAKLPAQPHA